MRRGVISTFSREFLVWVDSPSTSSALFSLQSWIKSTLGGLSLANPLSKTLRMFPASSIMAEISGVVFSIAGKFSRDPR